MHLLMLSGAFNNSPTGHRGRNQKVITLPESLAGEGNEKGR